ncbi:MAG: hypothetical protein ACLQBK_12035 [Candidatus Sulfotelmatobacter sp.]
MKFFVPSAENEQRAEDIRDATKKFAADTLGWQVTDRRIQSISFQDKGKSVQAVVGKIEPITGETVVVILESNTFLLCTPNRGVLRGMPILVGKNEVTSVSDFDQWEEKT